MTTLVTLATYEQSKTAYFLKEKLEGENIDCFFSIIGTTQNKWATVKVQVKDQDVENAIKVMLRIKEQYGLDIEKIEPEDRVTKILVPIDFSPDSKNACIYAIHLAQASNAEIKLLHVYEDPVADIKIKKSASFEDYAKQTLWEKETKVKSSIVDFTDKMKEYIHSNQIKNVRIHSSMMMGNVIRKIKGICQIYNPGVIVVGTVGKTEEYKNLLTGVVNEIINDLQIPVFAIPHQCKHRYFDKLNILYATDFNEEKHKSLDQLIAILESFNKQVTCIHIDTAHNPAKKERMDELNLLLKDAYRKYDISCQLIESADIFSGIKDFAEQNKINLLSFTFQKRKIFNKLFKPNLRKKILTEASLPILIFPS